MTHPADKIPDSISPKRGIESEKPLSQPPSTFESYMQNANAPAQGTPPGAAQRPEGTSPGELLRPAPNQTTAPSFNTLMGQARSAQDTLGTVEQQLNTPNLKLKRSQTHLLKNKLQDANGYIRSAGAKLGVDAPPMKHPEGANAIGRFLGYIVDGQSRLDSIQQKIKEMASSNDEMRPGEMLFIQVKLSQAQQEIEYSSTLLGKVVDSIKTILQTQL